MPMYIVSYGGGTGPDVWDAEMHISADNVQDALNKALSARYEDFDGELVELLQVEQIFSIEEE